MRVQVQWRNAAWDRFPFTARMDRVKITDIQPHTPVLIAGPTASGKSALALRIAREQGGTIINADALQVFDGWRILTARPDEDDLRAAPHALYGHVPVDQPYSVGDWLRDLDALPRDSRPIIVGGTGLYFAALTEGLAAIPPIPPDVRTAADALARDAMLADLDAATTAQIDVLNRARVQRAWEVWTATGRSIVDWQRDTPPPRLPLDQVKAFVLDAPKDWLTPRIAQRFDQMLEQGLLDEARAMRPKWDPSHPSSKAIGAPEIIAHIDGALSLDDTRDAVIIATRQYAKRQRTWFRRRMSNWAWIAASSASLSASIPLVD